MRWGTSVGEATAGARTGGVQRYLNVAAFFMITGVILSGVVFGLRHQGSVSPSVINPLEYVALFPILVGFAILLSIFILDRGSDANIKRDESRKFS
jgi:hypothetical protein